MALALTLPALAGPPYRTSDADTAPAGTIGLRVGVLRVQRDAGTENFAGPMLRLKFAFTDTFEVTSLADFSAEEERIDDGGLAFKLISREAGYNVGMETIALLPVSHGQTGIGIESNLLASFDAQPLRVHATLGGLLDPRGQREVRGWRSGIVVERLRAGSRFGLELFARKDDDRRLQLQLGAGVIVPVDRVKLRVGVHAGLTSSAPDLAASFWVTTEARNDLRGSAVSSTAR